MTKRRSKQKANRKYSTKSHAAFAAMFHRDADAVDAQELTLIVCEDAKAAPAYFRALRRHLRLTAASVEVCGPECGSAPQTVVEYAKQRKHQSQQALVDKGAPAFDATWCVVDVDCHPKLAEALGVAAAAGLEVALSNPCFEFWLILHYVDHRSRIASGADAVKQLKAYCPNYDKGSTSFEDIMHHAAKAAKLAKSILKQQYPEGAQVTDCNPSTTVSALVEHLHRQARK